MGAEDCSIVACLDIGVAASSTQRLPSEGFKADFQKTVIKFQTLLNQHSSVQSASVASLSDELALTEH